MTELPGRDSLCTLNDWPSWRSNLHDRPTWRGHFMHPAWWSYLEGKLHASCIPTWRSYLKRTLGATYMTDLPRGDTYMIELPGRDTSCNLPGGHTLCNLHDRPTWRGHFVHPTWWTYLVGTLRATYMIDLPGGDTSCTLHDSAYWGILRASSWDRPGSPSSLCLFSLFMHQLTLLFKIHIKKTYFFVYLLRKKKKEILTVRTPGVEPGYSDSGSIHWSTTPSKRLLPYRIFFNFKYYKCHPKLTASKPGWN